ncbi:protein containing Sporulation/cell division region, bacteria domain protein [gut metagenome]|uniref:Protein containing Sporulation/cell division region, bacteria domain protein n=1 Tax=gut metagenome TaxID=749906 RepID=J9GL52_9ZZZZ
MNSPSDVDAIAALNSVKTVTVVDQTAEPARDKTGKAINPGKVTPVTYWLQTGAYKNRDSAEAQRAELAMNLFTATVIESKGLWVVRVGPYETNQMAKEIQNQLSNSNIRSTIVTNR